MLPTSRLMRSMPSHLQEYPGAYRYSAGRTGWKINAVTFSPAQDATRRNSAQRSSAISLAEADPRRARTISVGTRIPPVQRATLRDGITGGANASLTSASESMLRQRRPPEICSKMSRQ